MKHLFLSFILFAFATLPFCSIARNANEYTGAPLSFIENKGQVTDQYGIRRRDVDVKLAAGGVNIFIGRGEIHYQWANTTNVKGTRQNVKNDRDLIDFKDYPGLRQGNDQPTITETYRMDVVLVGANKDAELVKEEKQKYYETYYTPTTGANGALVQSYNRVVYKNIYPNIDWILYSKNGELKYDFVVHPGGNVTDIQLQYAGATRMELNNGALIVTTPMGSITEAAPVSYEVETGKSVNSRYILQENVLKYEVTSNSPNGIVIDPVLNWATYYGGGYDDLISSVATDGSDNAYMTGLTTSSNNIATSGAFLSNFPGGQNAAFLAKFDMNGSRLWGTYYGGGGVSNTYFMHLAVDAGSNLYVGGGCNAAGLATTGAYQTNLQGKGDALLVKFSNSGSRIWATYLGDVDSELVSGICTDANNDVFIGGYMSGTTVTNMVTPAAFQTTPAKGFIAKFGSNGAKQWCTSYGDNTCDIVPASLSCDAGGNLVVGGYTACTNNIASNGAHQAVAGGWGDGFIVKFSNNGSRLWSTYLGGNLQDEVLRIISDPAGNLYVAGHTFHSSSGIASPGAWQPASSGTDDGFLARFDPSGVRQWGTYFGGSARDLLSTIAIGADGYLYVAGITNSTDTIATTGSTQTSYAGGQWDACLQVFTTSGQRVWGTYFGGPAAEFAAGYNFTTLCINPKGKVYIAGSTESNTGIATPGAHQTTLQNTRDGYLAKFDVNDLPPSAVGDVKKEGSVTVYPNPSDGRFILKGRTGNNEPILVQLINTIGQTVYSQTIQPKSGMIEHTISAKVAAGVYLLKAGTETVRVVVE